MTERVPFFRTYALILALCAMMFCALAQFALLVSFFGPNRGELPWPGGVAISAITAGVLVVAARSDGLLLKWGAFRWGLGALSWSTFLVMLVLTLDSPWELIHIPVWLNPSEDGYLLRRGIWRPLHVLHALGPIALVLAASATEQSRARRLHVVLSGVVPWLLGSALYAYLLTLPRPVYLG